MISRRRGRCGAAGSLACLVAVAALGGCNLDSFFNPAVAGYWEHTPTTIPILARIDAIEPADQSWGQTSEPLPEDLMPSDLTYRAVPGDVLTISIFELLEAGSWSVVTRRIDAGGFLRVPELGDIPGAGKTAQEIEDAISEILRQGYIDRPQVDVVIETGGAFTYTLYGATQGPGQYSIINSDLRLLDALASAGGLSPAIRNIFVIRQIPLTEEVKPKFQRSETPKGEKPEAPEPPTDIEDLINELEEGKPDGEISPGSLGQDEPPVDVDDLQPPPAGPPPAKEPPLPVQVPPAEVPSGQVPPAQVPPGQVPPAQVPPVPPAPAPPAVDVDELRIPPVGAEEPGTWVYVEERGEWVRVPTEPGAPRPVGATGGPASAPEAERLFVERVIKIPARKLTHGESRYNIVVRPKDRIFVEPPPAGVVYIDGEISRAGTFNLPPSGITLSRLVAAAGGLSQLAVPERVDLVRMVGPNREAVIRLNLAAIRHRTEPDVMLKRDDHVIIGTNWLATPLAIIRNGFRATYGFGFLLDRNFGNDVFGAPPTNFSSN